MAKSKKKKPKKVQPTRPLSPKWQFETSIPTSDFLGSLHDDWFLQEAVSNFVWFLEDGRFLAWEAVACEEQGLPLTSEQEGMLAELLSFNDEDDDSVLYIDEIARPSEPWHVILNKIVPHLVIEPFKTSGMYNEARVDGWNEIAAALKEHGSVLSLPEGISTHEEVVPADLRHKLWLQYCFNVLGGLGQYEELTLEDTEEHWRIEEFIEGLHECRASVEYFNLTLDSLMTRVILPEKDQPISRKIMQEKLGLSSGSDRLAEHL